MHTLLTNGVLRVVELADRLAESFTTEFVSLSLPRLHFVTSLNQGTARTWCISFASAVCPWVGGAASKQVWRGFHSCQGARTSDFQSTDRIYWLLEIIVAQRSVWSSRWWHEEFERRCPWLDNPKRPNPDPTPELQHQIRSRFQPWTYGGTSLSCGLGLVKPRVKKLPVFFFSFSLMHPKDQGKVKKRGASCQWRSMAHILVRRLHIWSRGSVEWPASFHPVGLHEFLLQSTIPVILPLTPHPRRLNMSSHHPAPLTKSRKLQDLEMLTFTEWLASRQVRLHTSLHRYVLSVYISDSNGSSNFRCASHCLPCLFFLAQTPPQTLKSFTPPFWSSWTILLRYKKLMCFSFGGTSI